MKKRIFYVMFGVVLAMNVSAQDSLRQDPIVVLGKSYRDSISLRWAPTQFSTWRLGNTIGYTIERYTIVRNNVVLNNSEKKILTAVPLKPLPEEQWEPLILHNKYAAITAQALYGDSFEIEMQQSDVFQVVNKVKENEQRFSFALFSSDMSSSVARASALFYTDKQVIVGERYLYRVLIYQPTDTLRGSVFIESDYMTPLPQPDNLTLSFQDDKAMLQWDRSSIKAMFTAYRIERSTDGKEFEAPSEIPTTTFSASVEQDSPFEYYSDSLPDITDTYYYRVRGITPFGEYSPPSDVVMGKSLAEADDVPIIIDGQNINNKTIKIGWEFPESSNTKIQGFNVQRSKTPQGPFQFLEKVNASSRSYDDQHPSQINYYRVEALALENKLLPSPIYLVQLVDSVAPVVPKNLRASVNEFGHVALSWSANLEEDIYGYRIYRSNVKSEELFQVTHEPILSADYIDTVNLNTLNEHIYYSLMAIDKNQNHSTLSARLEVTLPDKVRPQAPVFLPVKSDEKGVLLQWERSSSTDVVRYEVYGQKEPGREWQRIESIRAMNDTLYQFIDTTTMLSGKPNTYTVIAIDKSELESEPSTPVQGGKIFSAVRPKAQWDNPFVERGAGLVILKWKYGQSDIESFRIYKARGKESMILYKSLPPTQRQFSDKELIVGERYTYKIMVSFKNGSKSELSDSFTINY